MKRSTLLLSVVLLLLGLGTAGAQIRISEFPAAGNVTDADLVLIVQGGANKKATAAQIRTMSANQTRAALSGGNGTLNLSGYAVTLPATYLTANQTAAAYQPLSSNLTSWSAVVPGSYLTTSAAAAGYQPLSSNLTSWSGVVPGSYLTTSTAASTYQPLSSNLTSWAAQSPGSYLTMNGVRSALTGGSGALDLSGYTLTLPSSVSIGNTTLTDPTLLLTAQTGNFTAVVGRWYVTRANLTVTDPSGTAAGQEYRVMIGNGTATIGGVPYQPSRMPVVRYYNGSSWTTLAAQITGNLSVNGTTTLSDSTGTYLTGNSTGITSTPNWTLSGTNNTAPSQTASSGSSLMTRDLNDLSALDRSARVTEISDEFVGDQASYVGRLSWTPSGTGSVAGVNPTSSSDPFGILALTATGNNTYKIELRNKGFSTVPSMATLSDFESLFYLRLTDTTNVRAAMSFIGDTTFVSYYVGALFYYDSAVSGNWTLRTYNNSNGQIDNVDTGVAASTTWSVFNMRRVSGGPIQGRIRTSPSGSWSNWVSANATGITSSFSVVPAISINATTSSNRTMQIDAVFHRITFTR